MARGLRRVDKVVWMFFGFIEGVGGEVVGNEVEAFVVSPGGGVGVPLFGVASDPVDLWGVGMCWA
jgi:hypothetical protein